MLVVVCSVCVAVAAYDVAFVEFCFKGLDSCASNFVGDGKRFCCRVSVVEVYANDGAFVDL